MDIVELKHPMLVIDHFELLPSCNPGMFTFHAMGHMMDTQKEAYVVFPEREATVSNWVDQLVNMTKGYPGIAKQLLNKGLGEPIAEKVMALHNIKV